MPDSFNWFLKLRWCALAGQVLLLLVGIFFYRLTLPWEAIAGLLATIPFTDLLFRTLHQRGFREKNLIASLLLFDTLILSGVLYFSGGPTNPFSIVYLLHVVLAAVVLDKYWTWALAGITTLCFATLFRFHQQVAQWSHGIAHHNNHLDLHLHGMFFAYVLIATTVASVLTRIIEALHQREAHVQQLNANQQRLASLTTLATNTAHELGTPLSTITVIAHELELSLRGLQPLKMNDVAADVSLLKQETARCKAIIDELCSSSGSISSERRTWVHSGQIISGACYGNFDRLQIFLDCGSLEIETLPRALTTALKAIVKNALQASAVAHQQNAVAIHARYENNKLIIEVSDTAGGIPQSVLENIGKPFISTKASGEGMGLGIYIAKLIVQQLDGTLEFISDTKGTTARLSIPAQSRIVVAQVA